MNTPPYEPQVVQVSMHSVPAFDCPTLLVEKDGVFYVSVAVLKIDPRHPGQNDQTREGYTIASRLFKEAPQSSRGHAVVLEERFMLSAPMATPNPHISDTTSD